MDFPNYANQQRASHHQYQHPSRGSGGGGYPYHQQSVSYYHAPEASPPTYSSQGYSHRNDSYRSGEQATMPYRYQHNRSKQYRAVPAAATSSQQRMVMLERNPSENSDNLKPVSLSRGYSNSGDSMYGLKPAAKGYDNEVEEKYYHSSVPDHFSGKSIYEPEVPSLVGSENSSFEIPSDDDDENLWGRKIRPCQNDGLANGYFSEEEPDLCYDTCANPRSKHTSPRTNVVDSKPTASAQKIQVAPGEWLPLRGAAETWAAVQSDFYMPTGCVCCEQTIFCIQDAAFVLCPTCKVVSPGFNEEVMEGGVGLGFTMKELAKWQEDIGRAQREAAKRMW